MNKRDVTAPAPTLTIEDQLALQQLNADFAYYLDHHQVDALVSLFSEDAYYRHGERISTGRAAIEALFRGRSAAGDRVARHMISGLRLA
ncbi:MAG: nuclear transport factor 2 family protein, partial [Thiothrix sp.]|nr:nuclear transport factor 2 family protein [Thiothrix sp.]